MVAERLHTGPAAKPAQAARVDVWRLLGALATVPWVIDHRLDVQQPRQQVCMNPSRPCERCIFQASRWCPPTERAARAEWDRLELVAAATAGS